MAYRNVEDCNDLRDALIDEIGAVRKCANKKVERSTIRWIVSILLPILAGLVFAGVAYAFTSSSRIAKNEAGAYARDQRLARIESQLDRIEEYSRKAAAK